MSRGPGVHTVRAPEGDGWWTELYGKVMTRHRHEELAVETGREIARKLSLEHTIHREDGVITEKNSYGNDLFPPADGK